MFIILDKKIIELLTNISLKSNVLLKSLEVTKIDPILLAVPLPITILKTDNKENNENIIEYEHSFPTINELKHSNNENKHENIHMNKILKKHIIKILSTINNKETLKRLLDPHLLYYLMNIIDDLSLDLLYQEIFKLNSNNNNNNNRISHQVTSILDVVKMAITSE